MNKLLLFIGIGFLILSSACEPAEPDCPAPNPAQQQQNAHVHLPTNWTGSTYYNIDQKIRITELAPATFWTNQFALTNGGVGYMGLQTGNETTNGYQYEQARFSIWNANGCIAGEGSTCNEFGGEGVGWTVTHPIDLVEGHDYRLRVWKLTADTQGNWWGAWVKNITTNTEHYIGKIRLPNSPSLNGSISWTEYFGGSFVDIACVPRSTAYFFPPTANQNDDNNSYQYSSSYSSNHNIGNGTNGAVDNATLNGNSGVKRVIQGGI